MTPEAVYAWLGACVGVGLLIGAVIALVNSWRP
jgi:hypothetical protein